MELFFQKSRISEGLNSLRAELAQRGHSVRYIRSRDSNYQHAIGHTVINWGKSTGVLPVALNSRAHNASNKVVCFDKLAVAGIPTPDTTEDMNTAQSWIDEGSSVVCRTLTRASSGRGIVIANDAESLVVAPLYTRYVKKSDEYRVHVFNDEVIDVQRKARRLDVPDENVNWKVRTHDNGFIYMRDNVELPEDVLGIAKDAVAACGLTFGAVDIIYNSHYNSYYVLEINTAPGLSGTTVQKYADAIERLRG